VLGQSIQSDPGGEGLVVVLILVNRTHHYYRRRPREANIRPETFQLQPNILILPTEQRRCMNVKGQNYGCTWMVVLVFVIL